MQIRVEGLGVPSSHPSLAGHFPGAPVVPGVVLLSIIVEALRPHLGPFVTRRARNVKFVRQVETDVGFELVADVVRAHVVRFVCRQQGAILAEGTLEVEAHERPD